MQQAAQIINLLRRDEFHVKQQRHISPRFHSKRKLPGAFGNQPKTHRQLRMYACKGCDARKSFRKNPA
jgi:hypothetical protein